MYFSPFQLLSAWSVWMSPISYGFRLDVANGQPQKISGSDIKRLFTLVASLKILGRKKVAASSKIANTAVSSLLSGFFYFFFLIFQASEMVTPLQLWDPCQFLQYLLWFFDNHPILEIRALLINKPFWVILIWICHLF